MKKTFDQKNDFNSKTCFVRNFQWDQFTLGLFILSPTIYLLLGVKCKWVQRCQIISLIKDLGAAEGLSCPDTEVNSIELDSLVILSVVTIIIPHNTIVITITLRVSILRQLNSSFIVFRITLNVDHAQGAWT